MRDELVLFHFYARIHTRVHTRMHTRTQTRAHTRTHTCSHPPVTPAAHVRPYGTALWEPEDTLSPATLLSGQ